LRRIFIVAAYNQQVRGSICYMPITKTLRATPEQEDFAHKYTDEGSGKIGGMLIDGYFKAVDRLIALSNVDAQQAPHAIEIGCGEGFSTQRLRALLPQKVALSASEYVADMVPRAQAHNPGVTVTQESVYETKHADGTFDLVFLLEVLEHLDYTDDALLELRRIMKPGGHLIVGVPREPLWCALNMARLKYVKRFGNTPGHLNHWSTHTLKQYVGKYFSIEAVKTPLPWTLVLLKKRS
jgi:SAM-dependent methyltransferase